MNVSRDTDSHLNMSLDSTNFSQSSSLMDSQSKYAFFQHFKASDDVHRYLVEVGRLLVNERDKITQLFKRI